MRSAANQRRRSAGSKRTACPGEIGLPAIDSSRGHTPPQTVWSTATPFRSAVPARLAVSGYPNVPCRPRPRTAGWRVVLRRRASTARDAVALQPPADSYATAQAHRLAAYGPVLRSSCSNRERLRFGRAGHLPKEAAAVPATYQSPHPSDVIENAIGVKHWTVSQAISQLGVARGTRWRVVKGRAGCGASARRGDIPLGWSVTGRQVRMQGTHDLARAQLAAKTAASHG